MSSITTSKHPEPLRSPGFPLAPSPIRGDEKSGLRLARLAKNTIEISPQVARPGHRYKLKEIPACKTRNSYYVGAQQKGAKCARSAFSSQRWEYSSPPAPARHHAPNRSPTAAGWSVVLVEPLDVSGSPASEGSRVVAAKDGLAVRVAVFDQVGLNPAPLGLRWVQVSVARSSDPVEWAGID